MSNDDNALITKRHLQFFDTALQDTLKVVVCETIKPEYGLYMWPCSVVLAQYIWYHRESILRGRTCLEIGAGTGLPSIVALKCANPNFVIVTDKISCARTSFEENGITTFKANSTHSMDYPVLFLDIKWGCFTTELLNISLFTNNKIFPEVILGSDCFYDPMVFDEILSTVYFLLKSCSEAPNHGHNCPKFLCTYQTRSADWKITDQLERWNMEAVHIPLESFDAGGINIAASGMPGSQSIQMMEITLKRFCT
ncbi:histone-arginine methyltransferase METTL23-like [Clavelina lepadiformis]|uniref:Methyltransferase-like protein 23 n=1 Tax=Clavelina lepadiformis TaxID=159417 RepID=A0ABP0F6W8_CLALP